MAREVHTLNLYTKSNMFSLTYRRKYFMLNMINRLITTNQINLHIPVRETRQNRSPVIDLYVPINDTIAKSPVYVARETWNNQQPDTCGIVDHELFKKTVKQQMNGEYIASEIARLTAGIFC